MTYCLIIQTSWPKQRRVRLFNIHIVKQKQLGRFFLHHIFNLLQIRKTLQLILFHYGFSTLSSMYHTFSVYDHLKFCFRKWSEALWHIDFYMEQSLFRKPSLRRFQWSTAKCQEHIREQCEHIALAMWGLAIKCENGFPAWMCILTSLEFQLKLKWFMLNFGSAFKIYWFVFFSLTHFHFVHLCF